MTALAPENGHAPPAPPEPHEPSAVLHLDCVTKS